MTDTRGTMTAWQYAAAWIQEGLCLLAVLAVHLIELLLPSDRLSAVPALMVCAVAQGVLLSPWRLLRWQWYADFCRSPQAVPRHRLWLSPRPVTAAIGWRWRLWWRRLFAWCVAVTPAVAVWEYGSVVTDSEPLWWLLGGGILFLAGTVAAVLWQCRYAMTPLFLLEGYPAAAAMQLSVRAMRRRIPAYIDFWGENAGRLLSCLLIVPAIWALPTVHRRHAALLLSWREQTDVLRRRSHESR